MHRSRTRPGRQTAPETQRRRATPRLAAKAATSQVTRRVRSCHQPRTRLRSRFLTRDPLEAQTRSAYGYVNGDPLNGVDPSGLFACGVFQGLCDATSAVTGVENHLAHYAIDAVTDPAYLAYWGALNLNGAIHAGLGIDTGGDWLRRTCSRARATTSATRESPTRTSSEVSSDRLHGTSASTGVMTSQESIGTARLTGGGNGHSRPTRARVAAVESAQTP